MSQNKIELIHLGSLFQMLLPCFVLFFLGRTLGWNLSNITPVHCLDYYQSCQIVFQDDQQFETDHMNMTLVDKFSRHVKKYMQFFANFCLQDYYYTQVNFLFECVLC